MSPPLTAPGPASLIEQGLALIEAQRKAMLAGRLAELAAANSALAQWLARLPAAGRGAGSDLPLRADVVRARLALRTNADVAQRSASAAHRALAVLSGQDAPTYTVDGQPRTTAPSRRSVCA